MNASFLLYGLMLFFLYISLGKNKLKKLGFKKTDLLEETIHAVFYLFLMLAVTILIGVIFYSFGMASDTAKVPEIIKSISLEEVLSIIVVGSIVEEAFFRGYLLKKTNLLMSSFIFSYFHIIYGSLSEVIGAFFLGLILGIEFMKRKNLFTPALTHVLYNLIMILLVYSV